MVRSFICRQVNCAADAEDLAQKTLLKALRSRTSLRDQRRVRAWLFRIARRTIIDHYRRRRSSEQFTDAPVEPITTELDIVSEAVGRAALCYLGTLPQEYGVPVKLADYEGLPQAEIARRLGISLAATKSRIRRGRQRVRALLEECCVMVYDRRGKVVEYDRRQPCHLPRRD